MACGGLVFLASQTPRRPDGTRVGDLPFEAQVRRALDNLAAVASEAGASLHNAVKVTVYLQDPRRAAEFDAVYRGYVSEPPPARTCIGARLPGFDIEIDAVVALDRQSAPE